MVLPPSSLDPSVPYDSSEGNAVKDYTHNNRIERKGNLNETFTDLGQRQSEDQKQEEEHNFQQ